MELKGTQQIRRERAGVWTALNDPAVLQQCIPGCESLTADGDDSYQIIVAAAVGPVKARFKGKLLLTDIREQHGYSLAFEGSGGAAGFGKGGAIVALEPAGLGTLLTYEANAKVGGKLAQIGSRLIDGVAAKMAEEFFSRFKATVERIGATEDLPSIGQMQPAQEEFSAPQVVTTHASVGVDHMSWLRRRLPAIALLILVAVIAYFLGKQG